MIPGIQTEIIKLSDLAKHNNLDIDTLRDQIGDQIPKNICHLYEIDDVLEDILDVELDVDGRDDDVLVNLWD